MDKPVLRVSRQARVLLAALAGLPGLLVFTWEMFRHSFLDAFLPIPEGNILAGLVAALPGLVLGSGLAYRLVHLQQEVTRYRLAQLAAEQVEQEKQQLSQELHDSLAQVVYFLHTRLDGIGLLLQRGQVEAAQQELEALRQLVADLGIELRDLIAYLRLEITRHPFPQSLATLLTDFSIRHNLPIEADIDPQLPDLDPLRAQEVLRIVQEALLNVRKHAQATQVVVKAYCNDRGIEIQVRDNGIGFDPTQLTQKATFGLVGIAKRAERLAGRYRVESDENGTTVSVILPERCA